MYLENIVVDALDPQLVGRFWEAVVGGERATDEPGIYETRLTVDGGPVLDLCFQQQVGDAPTARSLGSTWTWRAGLARPRRSTACRAGCTPSRHRSGARCRGWSSPTRGQTRAA